MTTFTISVPSKTFLVGEYLVLKGGPAILLSTAPSFCMNVSPASSFSENSENIHPDSPAGRWLKKLNGFYSAYSFAFIDPYDSLGGFGASSAQFVMLYGLMQYSKESKIDEWEMVRDYKSCAWNGKGIVPSGADVTAQLKGGVCLFHHAMQQAQTVVWPFHDLEYGIIHTGHKLATHEHLKDLIDFDTSALHTIVKDAYKSIRKMDSASFVSAVNRYGAQLKRQGLLLKETENILHVLRLCSAVAACKGCGALGADVVLILYYKEKRPQVLRWIKQQKLHLITYGQDAAQGLVVRSIPAVNFSIHSHVNNEKLILVDKKDNKVGEIDKMTAHKKAMLHRAFSVFIFRESKGRVELLLQQRIKDKYHGGGLWTNTCCSHPHPGEKVINAAKKRLKEEMGLQARLHWMGKFHYSASFENGMTENEIDHVLVGMYNEDEIQANSAEVQNFQWMDIKTLKRQMKAHPERYTPWLKKALELALTFFNLDLAVEDDKSTQSFEP